MMKLLQNLGQKKKQIRKKKDDEYETNQNKNGSDKQTDSKANTQQQPSYTDNNLNISLSVNGQTSNESKSVAEDSQKGSFGCCCRI